MGNLGNSFGGLFKCRQRVRVTNASWRGEGKGSHGTQLSLDLEERPQIVVERAFSTLSTLAFTLCCSKEEEYIPFDPTGIR